MTQKTALLISAILTAFILVVGGGLIARLAQPEAAPEAVAAAPASDLNAQFQQIIQQREAAYQQLIAEANRRLQEMNQRQAATPVAIAAQPAPVRTTAPQAAAPQFAVSVGQAATIAAQSAGGAPVTRGPQLVRFEGKVAYEVLFAAGAVYVDANTGQVLFNGTQRPAASPQPAASGGGQNHEQEHEQEHGSEHD